MGATPPVIGFELGVGEFRIVTPEAVYQIKVTPELVKANTLMGVLSPAQAGRADAGPPSPANGGARGPSQPSQGSSSGLSGGADGGAVFFQEISQELFDRIGQLARQLSISVNELPPIAGEGDLSRTGADLEDAKGQLEEVVEITEKASIKIMDLADSIQADVDNLNKQMSVLTSLGFLMDKDSEGGGGGAAPPASEETGALFTEKFGELKSLIDSMTAPAAAPKAREAAPAPPPAPAEPSIRFSLDVVFQTLYEFCTNEAVKKHIKEMRDDLAAGGFDQEPVEKGLSDLAKEAGEDDGLYNIPLPALLKLIYSHTKSDKNKNNLKKMNQTVGSIFLDAVLPLEGEIVPAAEAPPMEIPPEAISTGDEAGGEEIGRLKALAGELENLISSGQLPPGAPGAGGSGGGDAYTTILKKDRDVIVNTLAASDALIKNTTSHLTHIMEALSFQDLSGQRIKRIVSLIGEIQVQLLSLLVSVDTKIKAHHEAPSAKRPKEETEKVAQAEVDKMLEKLNAEPSSELKGPGAENRLDQGAVNDLLSQLGF
jgi:chemotaxis regulatin CheY-phosphate phosphatase CheZ